MHVTCIDSVGMSDKTSFAIEESTVYPNSFLFFEFQKYHYFPIYIIIFQFIMCTNLNTDNDFLGQYLN